MRLVLKIHPALAPVKAAIFPLIKKRHSQKAREIYLSLKKQMMVSYDETGTIGKRYRRADAVGTPFAVTVDDETLENGTVTLRNRDTMEQEKVAVDALAHYISRNTQLRF